MHAAPADFDRSVSGDFGDLSFDAGMATFKLGDGDRLTAEGLPMDIGYRVEEVEANADGYVTMATEDTGVVKLNETVSAVFENRRDELEVLDPDPAPNPDPQPQPTWIPTCSPTIPHPTRPQIRSRNSTQIRSPKSREARMRPKAT